MVLRVKFVILLFLISILLWWVGKAVLRYWNEPLSTEISYSFGDNDNGIQFPLITLCQHHFYLHNSILRNCKNQTRDFMPSLQYCLKNNLSFKIDDFMESLTIKRENVIFKTELWTGSEYVKLNDLIWSKVFYNAYGLCFTADLSEHSTKNQ